MSAATESPEMATIYKICYGIHMGNPESKSYMDMARDMAQQFENGENVDASNIAHTLKALVTPVTTRTNT